MFEVEFHQYMGASGRAVSVLRHSGHDLGRPLVEAAHATAGYRFLPVFYLAHAAYLGWSPNTEQMLPGVFRPGQRLTRTEDAGPETLMALFTLQYAERFADDNWAELLDPHLVRGVAHISAGIGLPFAEEGWTRALSGGLASWRDLRTGKGTSVLVDTRHQRLNIIPY
ncbi:MULTISPECIES: hypothetical protein [unclassified Streptomyces]|uniref:hypothetical protein n=1 Tax=unclassified Streptomyces TaxID=2593676 RepID=UPI003D922CE4